jgi:hypothetical protein
MNIIYGASFIGKIVLEECKKRNVTIDYFCDEQPKKIGSFISGIEVVHPSQIDKTTSHFIITIINIKDVIKKLGDCSKESCISYIENFHTDDIFIQSVVDMCRFTHRSYIHPEKLLISNVDLVITEKCSLKCQDCANLMQYYSSPQNINNDVLYKSIDKFCDLVDEIQEFRMIGGEIFMNKNHNDIIQKISSKKNINYIMVYSNGTFNIPEEQLWTYTDSRIVFSLTDYGKNLSKNIHKFIRTLEKLKIKYYVARFEEWYDCAKILTKTTNNVFHKCCANGLLTILYDKLYKCPFSAHGIHNNLIPDNKKDYLNIFKITKDELKNYIDNLVPESCYYCQGRIMDIPTIKPAIQLTK